MAMLYILKCESMIFKKGYNQRHHATNKARQTLHHLLKKPKTIAKQTQIILKYFSATNTSNEYASPSFYLFCIQQELKGE